MVGWKRGLCTSKWGMQKTFFMVGGSQCFFQGRKKWCWMMVAVTLTSTPSPFQEPYTIKFVSSHLFSLILTLISIFLCLRLIHPCTITFHLFYLLLCWKPLLFHLTTLLIISLIIILTIALVQCLSTTTSLVNIDLCYLHI